MQSFGSSNLNLMITAAKKAGRSLLKDFLEVENLQVSLKGPADFVSAADLRADKIIRDELKKARPSYGILTEESGDSEGEDTSHRFIVDPLDGTSNFLHSIPFFAVNIALEENREIIAGVTYNPISDELYYAEKGAGAFLFGGPRRSSRLRVSRRKSLDDGIVYLYSQELRAQSDKINHRIIRRFGAQALELASIAAGRADVLATNSCKLWDVAAGIILIKEAGGIVDVYNEDKKLKVDGNAMLFSNGAAKDAFLAKIEMKK